MAKTKSAAPTAETGIEVIPAYTYEPNPCPPSPKLWNAKTKTFTPRSIDRREASPGFLEVDEYLYSITAAVEAGVVQRHGWVAQLFGTPELFELFLAAFEDDYTHNFRIPDRVAVALSSLGWGLNEEDTTTAEAFAQALRDEAESSDQL